MLMNVLNNNNGKYSTSSHHGDMMLGFVVSLEPWCGHIGLDTVIPNIIGSIFINAKVKLNIYNCIDITSQTEEYIPLS